MKSSVILSIIGTVLIIILAIQNSEAVSLRLFFWDIEMSLSLMLLVVFLLGGLSGYILNFSMRLKRQRGNRNI
ncbi:MAG: lipopolysaccharide assembly protein LapA domain-containing protein [Lentimicrobiaceae bacterium]|nr:lipopolysaccharide assembly protein LapA domain-containing protein [Lentimicrobiaceae bacterium]